MDVKALKREIWVHRMLSAALVLAVIFAGMKIFFFKEREPDVQDDAEVTSPSARLELPYYIRVKEAVSQLEYSGLPALVDPNVTLSIDFEQRQWTLHNLHKFDAEGNVLLDQGRYGLCGELAAYTYRKIQPLFGDEYIIRFVRAAEAGFFLRPLSSHTVLVMINKKTSERFFLDPSFRRYGREADFKEYMFYEVVDPQTHFSVLKPDVVFPIDAGTPVLIRDKFILYLTTESVEGRFDKENFILALTANKRYEFAGRYVFALRVQDGKPRRFKNEMLLSRFLSQEESRNLLDRLERWFDQYEKEEPLPTDKI